YSHQAPWLDQTRRIFRAFELLETGNLAAGNTVNGRIPGKININTIFDPEPLLAITDPQSSNNFGLSSTNPGGGVTGIYDGSSNPYNPATIFGQLMLNRSPSIAAGGPIGGTDSPFLGLAPGYTPPPASAQYPTPIGINNTILAPSVV